MTYRIKGPQREPIDPPYAGLVSSSLLIFETEKEESELRGFLESIDTFNSSGTNEGLRVREWDDSDQKRRNERLQAKGREPKPISPNLYNLDLCGPWAPTPQTQARVVGSQIWVVGDFHNLASFVRNGLRSKRISFREGKSKVSGESRARTEHIQI